MTTRQETAPPTTAGFDEAAKLREKYECGPVQLCGTEHGLYERHLLFDHVIKPTAVGHSLAQSRTRSATDGSPTSVN